MARLLSCNNTFSLLDAGVAVAVRIADCGEVVDLSGYTSLEFIFKKPITGTILTRTALIVGDDSNGQVYYTFQVGELDEVGYWQAQVKVDLPDFVGHTDTFEFYVADTLD